jgi:TRAP-type uncharacterized transport system fused permease subunit
VYYGAVFVLVHLLAKKRHADGNVTKVELNADPILPRLYMLLPVVSLMVSMGIGLTIQRAALYAILTVIVLNFISRKKHRRSILEMFNMVMDSTKKTSSVGMPLCG